MTLTERLNALGFDYMPAAGGYHQWLRTDGQINEMLYLTDAPDEMIDSEADHVSLDTYPVDGAPSDPDFTGVPLWAFLDACEGCDCFALLTREHAGRDRLVSTARIGRGRSRRTDRH